MVNVRHLKLNRISISPNLDIDDEIQQSTALQWLSEFISFANEVMVPFIPRLIPAILPNLAHHVPMIQSAAIRTNKLLLNVVQSLPSPSESAPQRPSTSGQTSRAIPASPTPTPSSAPSRQSNARGEVSSPDIPDTTPDGRAPSSLARENAVITQKSRGSTFGSNLSDMGPPPPPVNAFSRPQSPTPSASLQATQSSQPSSQPPIAPESDLFDYQATVNELTVQFLSEHEETRVAALKWLIMLHQKAPKHVSYHWFSLDMH